MSFQIKRSTSPLSATVDSLQATTASLSSELTSVADTTASLSSELTSVADNQGLTFVKSQAIGTGVTSVTVTDAFSSTFTGYRIFINHQTQSFGGADVWMNLGDTLTFSEDYWWMMTYHDFSGGSPFHTGNASSSNKGNWTVGQSSSTSGGLTTVEIYRPYLTERTLMNFQSGNPEPASFGGLRNGFGLLNNASSYASFIVRISGGTMSGGNIRVYGYNEG